MKKILKVLGILLLIGLGVSFWPFLLGGWVIWYLWTKQKIQNKKIRYVVIAVCLLLTLSIGSAWVSAMNSNSQNQQQQDISPTITATPVITETPTDTPIPTDTPVPTVYVPPTTYDTIQPTSAASDQSAPGLSNNNYYTNSDGNQVHSPAYSNNGSVPAGATAQCKDGTYSFSQHHSGTCSGHGGVAQWY